MAHKAGYWKGTAEAAGSTLIHKVPLLRPIARRLVGLTGPDDLLLRWRMDDELEPNMLWARDLTVPDAEVLGYDLSTWSLGVLAVRKTDHREALSVGRDERRPAVGYRMDEIGMVGVREIGRFSSFASTFEEAGLGVIVRIGEKPADMALGTALMDGTDFRPLPTRFVYPVSPQAAAELYRI